MGEQIKFILLGDTNVGQEALLRFYVLHVAVLPAVLMLLIAVHFWRIRKDGGLSRPEEVAQPAPAPVAVKVTAMSKLQSYGLQGFRPYAVPEGRQEGAALGHRGLLEERPAIGGNDTTEPQGTALGGGPVAPRGRRSR